MGEIKNPFSFGTGDIDKDQWLRDIDNELEDFITRYGSATNKHRTALLRLAFLDLRGRIASGDMLNRTADGNYQFGSALNRDDKHMQEAYQRALGFMGLLARRQITSPTPVNEPEKKKIGSLEERYIRSLNPSGKLNTKAYWDNQTDDLRRESLTSFLNKELQEAGNYNDFEGFGTSDEYKKRLNTVLGLLNSKTANDYSLQQLGFTLNWLTKPKDEEETETPKSELEQANERLQAATEAQQVQQINQLIAAITAPSPSYQTLLTFNPSKYWTYDSFNVDRDKRIEALKYVDKNGNEFLKAKSILGVTPTGNGHFTKRITTKNTAWNGLAADEAILYALRQYEQEVSSRLNNYFRNLGVNYRSIINNDKENLKTNLALLFTQNPDNKYVMEDVINNLFVKLQDGKYGLKGSTLSYDPSTHTLYNGSNIDTYKEGGTLKGLNGLIVDPSYYRKPKNNDKKTEETPKLENSREMDTGDWVTIIGTTAADIGSMLSANAVGYGTIASAGLGLTSTLGNSANELRHGNIGSGLANLGIGLTTDLIGLVPGFGAGAKGWKIGRTLTRFARPILSAMAANNYKEAGLVMNKGLKNGWGSLNAEDWALLGTTLTSMFTRGKSAHTRQKNVEFISKASQHSSPTNTKGNVTRHIINEEGFIKARKELLLQKRFGYNTSSRNYTLKMWQSIPEGGEVLTPFYARPFEYPRFGFGKNKKLKLVERFEEFLKHNKEPEFSTLSNGSDSPIGVPTDDLHQNMRNGAKLKALRNGGIIKGLYGIPEGLGRTDYKRDKAAAEMSLGLDSILSDANAAMSYNFGMNPVTFPNYNKTVESGGAKNRGDLKPTLGKYMHNGTLDYLSALDAQSNYFTYNNGKNIMGDVLAYYNDWLLENPNGNYETFVKHYNENVDTLRTRHKQKWELDDNGNPKHPINQGDWTDFNTLHHKMYRSYGKYKKEDGTEGDDWDESQASILGESTWRRLPNAFNGSLYLNLRSTFLKEGDSNSKIYMDTLGHLQLGRDATGRVNVNNVNEGTDKLNLKKVVDSASGIGTIFNDKLKDPWDPTLLTIAGKTWLGLNGNKNIYGNLLNEMPQAPLRDPIDRKLAILGWQDQIKQGLNQLADLRNIYGKLIGADSQVNLGGALEVEGKGRGIMDDKYMKDSLRQFDTAQKSWNLDNEDYLYNVKVGDDNRRAIADRARMIAQIRAAWRSGDNNILMGGLADASNWLLKRYQREQDTVDKAKEIALGTPEEWALSLLTSKLGDLANKKASELTAAEEAKVKAIKAQILREMRLKFSERYYDMYHNPMFGTGYDMSLLAKDGTKLEVAKLKARSKDNDRYVSMIKDLRTSRRRRRR